MEVRRPDKDIAEIFGRDPLDRSEVANEAWRSCGCPFTRTACTKTNHDRTVTYGTCVLSSGGRLVVVCPKRFYGNDHAILKHLGSEHFPEIPVLDFDQYQRSDATGEVAVLLGQGSGREVCAGTMSLDWVVARVSNRNLVDFVAVEVQSIDITGNYRECWSGYSRARVHADDGRGIPSGSFGFNWANVHKRIIPQLIRKSLLIQRAGIPSRGIELVLPDAVFERFDEVMDFATLSSPPTSGGDTIRIRSYALSTAAVPGQERRLQLVRSVAFGFENFAARFVSSTGPSGASLRASIEAALRR